MPRRFEVIYVVEWAKKNWIADTVMRKHKRPGHARKSCARLPLEGGGVHGLTGTRAPTHAVSDMDKCAVGVGGWGWWGPAGQYIKSKSFCFQTM